MIVAGGRKEIDGRIISFMRFSIDCSTELPSAPPTGAFAVPPSTAFSSPELTA